jgi:chromate transporter
MAGERHGPPSQPSGLPDNGGPEASRPVSLLGRFFTFFRIGAFTFGGGLAMIGVIRHELVVRRSLLDEEELGDAVGIATAFPGPIAINIAFLLGRRFGGKRGSLVSILGVVLPSVVVILGILVAFGGAMDNPIASRFFKGAAAAVAAQILFSGIVMGKAVRKDPWSILVAAAALAAAFFLPLHPALVIFPAVIVRLLLPPWKRSGKDKR